MQLDGSCYTDIITNTIKKLKEIKQEFIVVRSTVPINYCKENDVYFMPEFLTEKNWKEDFINNGLWIFGLIGDSKRNELFMEKTKNLINIAHINGNIKSHNIIYMKYIFPITQGFFHF